MDFSKLISLLTFNAVVAGLIVLLLFVLARTKPATFAVVRRNFVGYFSTPTGYVFICVFMLLSSIAAFWPQAFFSDNLATLYQLNRWFPPVMLIFIPAITMSIWSEEQREGTDELLLTMPASDVDIVMGKYLAAALIFSVALFFSQIVNFRILHALSKGDLDMGLFVSTYVGYWLMGLAMIAIGMTASFFTSNLTVGYILGALFNAPLVFLTYADRLVPGRAVSQALANWSLAARFRDFGRGVISLSSTWFFLALIATGIYVSLVLIGRRHWLGGKDGKSMLGHYLVRAACLVAMGLGTAALFANHDVIRKDLTSGKVSSLSPESKAILQAIPADRPVMIEAFASASVPEAFVETRVDLLNTLRELDAAAGNRLKVKIEDNLEPFTDEAARAEVQYGIKPRAVVTRSGGGFKEEELILGAAVVSGLERVVIPFFGRGIPVEYELVRSIKTVTGAQRRRLGVVKTDAQMFGGFDMSSFSSRPKQRIIEELEKQFDVDEVDPSSTIDDESFDALLVVQPSSLTPPQLDNLMAAIRNGVPTGIFEDPMPVALNYVAGTGEPRRPRGNPMFGGGPPPEPKCDLTKLWKLLGMEMVGEPTPTGEGFDAQVIFQAYNPYPNVSVANITNEWVFVSPEAPTADDEALSIKDPVTAGLQEVLCIFPGGIRNLGEEGLEFTTLMKTSEEAGWISVEDYRMTQGDPREVERAENLTRDKKYILAGRIKGTRKDPLLMSEASSSHPAAPQTNETTADASDPASKSQKPLESDADAPQDDPKAGEKRQREIHVVYVSDIDMLSSDFLAIREEPDEEVNWRFENVTFVLNVLDSLVGEKDLIEVRKRRPRHSTLKRIDEETEDARLKEQDQIAKYSQQYKDKLQEEQKGIESRFEALKDKVAELETKAREGDSSARAELTREARRLAVEQQLAENRIAVRKEQIQQDLQRELEKTRHERDREIQRRQFRYKLSAVWPALVLPLVVGLGVWIIRSQKEQEGVSEIRRR